jgi:type II secretory pathway pseudopilin PulG
MSAVASIIALLALILIPILRSQINKSRITAAMDDMAGIEKALLLAFAETDYFPRLQDLDNPANFPPDHTWKARMTESDKARYDPLWGGPYMPFNRTKYGLMNRLVVDFPSIFRNANAGGGGGGGPILYDTNFPFTDEVTDLEARYPIDPWGTPYLYFAPGSLSNASGAPIIIGSESNFSVGAIYSLGPNGVPGNLGLPLTIHYFRESGVLGTGDDLERIF